MDGHRSVRSSTRHTGARGLAWLSALALLGSLLANIASATTVGAAQTQASAAASTVHSRSAAVNQSALQFNSFDSFYRTPFGAVPYTQTVTLRFRTAQGDASQVLVRFYDLNAAAESYLPMTKFLSDGTYDYYQIAVPAQTQPNVVYYKFKVIGTDNSVIWYEEQSGSTGGQGQAYATDPDNSWHVTFYDPSFQTPDWMKNAILYQIFPDRFKNGSTANDSLGMSSIYTTTGVTNVLTHSSWTDLPNEPPTGNDFFGGDIKGIDQEINNGYFDQLHVTGLYLNPVFFAPSNHKYDTANYLAIDPRFGTMADFQQMVTDAHAHGIHIILDGVFNHTSSDSYYFNKYGHFNTAAPFDPLNPMASYTTTAAYTTVGAYNDQKSPYYYWYTWNVWPSYNGWFGYDSLPKLWPDQSTYQQPVSSTIPTEACYIYSCTNSVAQTYVRGTTSTNGADGWRLDVADNINNQGYNSLSGSTTNHNFLKGFRTAVKGVNPNAVLISEIWYDASPWFLGDQVDSTMNYRFRNAIDGFMANGVDTDQPHGGQTYTASQFNQALTSIMEDYPPQVFQDLMNLVDSHDRIRLRWGLGDCDRQPYATSDTQHCLYGANPTASQEATINARQQMIATLQFGYPGAPQIYYGDEVGMTGYADPDDRRTFPRLANGTGAANPIQPSILTYYQNLGAVRSANPVLRTGSLTTLLTDDANGTYAVLRATSGYTTDAVVLLNNNSMTKTLSIPVGGYLPDGATLKDLAIPGGAGSTYTVATGTITVTASPYQAFILLTQASLTPPAAPTHLTASGASTVSLSWNTVSGATSYQVYRSLVSGSGYAPIGSSTTTSYTDSTVTVGTTYHYVVKASINGLMGSASNEVSYTPFYAVGYANLQYPPTQTEDVTAVPDSHTVTTYGQIYIAGVTDHGCGAVPGLIAQVGYGPQGSDPTSSAGWTWFPMSLNSGHQTSCNNNSEYMGQILPNQTGTFAYVTRFSTDGGHTFVIGCYNTGTSGSNDPGCPSYGGRYAHGTLTVQANPATASPPAIPTGLFVSSETNTSATFTWNANTESNLYDYQVFTSTTANGFTYTTPAAVVTPTAGISPSVTLANLTTGQTVYVAVAAVNTAYGVSAASNPVSGTALLRTVLVTFRVRVPAATPPTDTIYISGNIPQLCNYCGGGTSATALTQMSPSLWAITIPISDGTAIQYKYTRGSYNSVEAWGTITGLTNRQAVVSYGLTGTQLMDDTATNWGDTAVPDDHKAVETWRDPLVTQTLPAAGTSGAAPSSIVITMSEAVQSPPSTAVAVSLAGTPVPGSTAANGSLGLTWAPSAPLVAGVYAVTVAGLKGPDGDPMQNPYTFSFTATTGAPVSSTPTPIPTTTAPLVSPYCFPTTPPVQNGIVASGEYGTASNQYSNAGGTGQTWSMTWDNTNLYVGISNATIGEALVLYVGGNLPTGAANGGSAANGNLSGFQYDNTQFTSLPFRASFVTYIKNGYREYRTANGTGGWSSSTSNYGSYGDSTTNNVREIAIPWSAITGAGRPSQFAWMGYITSSGGYIYGQLPSDNPHAFVGTSATASDFYAVPDTSAALCTPPFAISSTDAAHFQIDTPPSFVSGVSFPVTVTALTPSGVVAVGYRGTIHFSSTDASGTLPPDYTFTAADNGVHLFPSIILRLPDPPSYTVAVSDTTYGGVGGTSNPVLFQPLPGGPPTNTPEAPSAVLFAIGTALLALMLSWRLRRRSSPRG